ncbi:MAG: hypothetical protein JNM85_01870 [Chthonomonas sp.]|nr:hypothetical protein [Chthonomonas sp.]
MLVSTLVALVAQLPLRPDLPLFREGEAVALRNNSAAILEQRDRVTIGKWFDGFKKRDVEYVLWLNDEVLSRITGYWATREGWTDEEVQSRWTQLHRQFMGKQLLFVQLTAYPKFSTLDLVPTAPAGASDTRDPRVTLVRDGRKEFPVARLISAWQTRERAQIEAFSWIHVIPELAAIKPQRALPPRPPLYNLGDYFGAWYLIELPEDLARPFEVRISTAQKLRIAKFDRLKPKG